MKVYDIETKDGLQELIKASASVALTCAVMVPNDIYNKDRESAIAKILASSPSNPDQQDLYYLNSVLVSTGWNKNDDVFDIEQAWAARETPVDKQFNFMHDESDIIGHITGSIVFDRDGNNVTNQETPPDAFDIVTSAVVYTAWSDEDQKSRITNLISEIDEGKWAVSMECLFNDFDYAVISPDGTHKVIARDETSAFLTKHLRSYGGTGEYEGFTLGRQLKNIVFSGKGLVSNPANPRSIIFDKDVNPFKSESQLSIANIKGVSNMDLEKLQAQNSELKAEIEKLKADAVNNSKADLEDRITALETSVEEKDTANAELTSQVTALTEEVEAEKDKNNKFKENLEKMKKEKKDEKRKASLIQAGQSTEDAEASLVQFAELSDEAFDAVVAIVAAKTKAEAEKAEVVVVAEDADTEADVDEVTEAEAEADKDDLEDVEVAEAGLNDPGDEDDGRGASVASLTNWLSESVLKSTHNLKT